MMMWPVTSLLAHLWHPKRANERQLPTNTVGRRARLDDGSGAFLPVAVACNERPVRGSGADIHGVFAECSPFILDDQAAEVRLEQAFTEAFREHVGCADIWAGGGLRRCLRHLNTRRPRLEVRDDLFAEEAKSVEHLLVLRRPDRAQQDHLLDAEGLV
jgi:hypothetical protein